MLTSESRAHHPPAVTLRYGVLHLHHRWLNIGISIFAGQIDGQKRAGVVPARQPKGHAARRDIQNSGSDRFLFSGAEQSAVGLKIAVESRRSPALFN